MKTLLSITLCLICLASRGQQYVNTNAPTVFTSQLPGGAWISGNWVNPASSNQLVSIGWLTVSNTVAPVAGWTTTSNAVVPYIPINGWCQLVPALSNNIQATLNASITNSPLWTGMFAYSEQWASVLDAYQGSGAETNAVVNYVNSMNFFRTNYVGTNLFISIPTNAFNAGFLVNGTLPFIQLGFTSTVSYFQWFRANITNQ